jgi:uncharacterized protein
MSCPMCDAESEPKYRPFCSKRCADHDLGKWLNESYSSPSYEPEDMEKAQDEAERARRKPH